MVLPHRRDTVGGRLAWAGFWLLTLIWGTSFLLIRVGVEQLPTFQLVFIRTAIAAVGLHVVVYMRGLPLPTDWSVMRDLLVLGIVNTVLPFSLITWGEQYVESGLTAVLQGTTALFTMVLAHVTFADERVTRWKLAGLLSGFGGVVLLAGRPAPDLAAAIDPRLYLGGQLAMVAAAFCYAVGGTYSRRAMQRRLHPTVAAAGSMTVTAVITGAAMLGSQLAGGEAPVSLADMRQSVLLAVITLGLLNTFVAYLIFYSVIDAVGAGRASMVTYVIPAVGLFAGALFLDEPLDARLLVGAAIIVGSVALVNVKR